MWPSRTRVKRGAAEAHTARGPVVLAGGFLDVISRFGSKSTASELATYEAPEFGAMAMSFQQRLRLAGTQGVTLREFEKLLG